MIKDNFTKTEMEELFHSIEDARSCIKSIYGSIENGYGMNKKKLKEDLSFQESHLTNMINFYRKKYGLRTLTEAVNKIIVAERKESENSYSL